MGAAAKRSAMAWTSASRFICRYRFCPIGWRPHAVAAPPPASTRSFRREMRPPARVRRRISRINCFSEVRCVESRLRLCGQPEAGDGFGDRDVELRLRHAEPAADGELGRLDITGKEFAEKSPACWSKVTMLDFRPENGGACSASRPPRRGLSDGKFCAIFSHSSAVQLCWVGPRPLK